jgi:hypothetical protein
LLSGYPAQRSDQLIAGLSDWVHVHGHTTNVASAAQIATNPSAMPVAVRHAPIVSIRFARAVAAAPPARRSAWDRT